MGRLFLLPATLLLLIFFNKPKRLSRKLFFFPHIFFFIYVILGYDFFYCSFLFAQIKWRCCAFVCLFIAFTLMLINKKHTKTKKKNIELEKLWHKNTQTQWAGRREHKNKNKKLTVKNNLIFLFFLGFSFCISYFFNEKKNHDFFFLSFFFLCKFWCILLLFYVVWNRCGIMEKRA